MSTDESTRPGRWALVKFHAAVVVTILILIVGYVAFSYYVFSQVVDTVLATYGTGNIPAMLALLVLFALMVGGFAWTARTVPKKVAELVAARVGLEYRAPYR